MKSQNIKLHLTALVLIVLTYACTQDQIVPTNNSIEVKGGENAIFPYNFDWENPNLNWMPYPSTLPKIPLPWTGAGSLFGTISTDVLNDRKKVDGWELVYNTFDPAIANPNPHFILYNKYRGLLRIYMYMNNSIFASSSYLQDGLFIGTNNYKLLNFAENAIVDASQNQVRVDRIQPKPYNGPPLGSNKWYFTQYEIAYDASITPVITNPPQISYYFNSINIDQISLGGTIQGEVKGTIGASQKTGGQNIWSAATPGLKSLGTAALSAIGAESISDNTTDTNGGNKFGIKPAVWKKVKTSLESAMGTAVGSLPGTVSNIVSAIIGGSSSSGQTVNLTLGGTLHLNGEMTSSGSLPSSPGSFYIPGSVKPNSSGIYQVQGYVPLYNKKLGVFNLANTPTVRIQVTKINQSPLPVYQTQYSIKTGTLNLQWNPVVNGEIATISNQRTEIIALWPNDHQIKLGKEHFQGREEDVDGKWGLSAQNNTLTTVHKYNTPPIESNEVLVRISFVVNPKNGGAKSAIIKTFKANIERSYVGF